MRDTATTSRLPGLFKLAALAAVTVTLLITSGCGKKCCGERKCNTCNTCNTCTSCNQPQSTCTTCSTCGTADNSVPSGQYDRVGQAPQSLSEPMSAPVQTNVYTPPPQSSATQSNVTFDRVGTSRDLPVFSPAPTAIPQSAPIVTPTPAAPAPAQLLPTTQPRSSGSQTHTLQKGETVYGISRQYGVSPKAVLAANHFSDPNRLAVGTKVIIPAN